MQDKKNSLLDSLSTNFPWTERIWKNLESQTQTLNSALFFGKPGLGKSHTALKYTMQLLQNNEVFLSGNHPDVHVLLPEEEAIELLKNEDLEEGLDCKNMSPQELIAAYGSRYFEKSSAKPKKIISVQQIRALIEQVVQHPNLSKHKVVIIKSADKMNTNSANALLKTLEEPPQNTSFILLADQIERLPITIRSRCAEFHFRAPDQEIGLQWLEQQGLHEHTESYLMMANQAPLQAIELAKAKEIENLRTLFSSINQLWAKKISPLELATQWKKFEFQNIFNHLNRFLTDLTKLKSINVHPGSTEPPEHLFYPVQKDWCTKIALSVEFEGLFNTIDEIQSIQRLGNGPSDKQLLLENAAIQLEKLAQNHA
ncbi:MAG: hypothetical protein ACRBEE_10660 [Arenicella sp.]